MTNRRQAALKWLVIGLLVVGFAGAAVVGYLTLRDYGPQPTVETGKRTLYGTVTCLPKAGPGPHTMECALGLETHEGVYKLSGITPDLYRSLQAGEQLEVQGAVVPKSEADAAYVIVGTIEITHIRDQ